jgi:hypothetical protein
MKIEDMVFEKRGPGISLTDISKVEAAIGATLPQDYRQFLLLYNGGISKLCVSDYPLSSFRIRDWMSICEHKELPGLVSLLAARENIMTDVKEFGRDFLAIGELPFGQFVVVTKLVGQDAHRIGVCDLEEPWRKVELPFTSFTDLIDHCVQRDDFI